MTFIIYFAYESKNNNILITGVGKDLEKSMVKYFLKSGSKKNIKFISIKNELFKKI